MKKIKKFFTSLVVNMAVLIKKVQAATGFDVSIQSDYGVQEPKSVFNLTKTTNVAYTIITSVIVPIILLIGLIVFLLKSTSSVAKKIIVSIAVIAVYIIFRIIINLI